MKLGFLKDVSLEVMEKSNFHNVTLPTNKPTINNEQPFFSRQVDCVMTLTRPSSGQCRLVSLLTMVFNDPPQHCHLGVLGTSEFAGSDRIGTEVEITIRASERKDKTEVKKGRFSKGRDSPR
ncbi:hypothetical protein RvY_14601 [Ramazzottius varieornatus]|uniref:Uncharacterized protein n=1 Tax=Ramazzottius varieornatus TaxID=947166 RepID=A0A1D1VWY8_RAMVA|nr:hypothetical protein RvY_14601 [Ramazzottius varieornatus]